ncbi:MAG TPA: hypothetical protein VL500_00605 [Candidatus Eisenbacteria bacterium]|nr:hypothetical protein [Candidatus Eisenbacteria bacterium]
MPRNNPGEPDVPSSVTAEEADAPIDQVAVRKTTSESLYETGAAAKGTQPVVEKVHQSGTDPNVEYQYFLGSDKKIYGKGQKLPEGVEHDGFVRIIVENLGEQFYGRVIITKDVEGNLEETAYSNSSMGDAIPLDANDPNSAPRSAKGGEEMRRYATKDPKVAVRQAIVDAQGHGILFDPTAGLYRKKPVPKILPGLFLGGLIAAIALVSWLAGAKPATAPQPPAPAPSPASPQAAKNADGSVSLGDRKYYVVYGNDKSKDTGNEVCAAAGKSCVGYTDLTTSVCMAVHPGAEVKSDFDGSSAGFYCHGAPQGGVCGKETNTCHICPACNINMDCAMEVGVLYNEAYVECK